jgi:hypothetical protein
VYLYHNLGQEKFLTPSPTTRFFFCDLIEKAHGIIFMHAREKKQRVSTTRFFFIFYDAIEKAHGRIFMHAREKKQRVSTTRFFFYYYYDLIEKGQKKLG